MILVFIEHKNCVLNRTSLEAIAAAQAIGKDLGLRATAVIPCGGECPLAQEIAGYDLEKVIVVKNDKLGTYTPDGYADAWEQVIKATNPKYVVMSHTYQVRDFAPKVAARLGREVVGDVIRYRTTRPPKRRPPLLRQEGSGLFLPDAYFWVSLTRTLPLAAMGLTSLLFNRVRSAATMLPRVPRRSKRWTCRSAIFG